MSGTSKIFISRLALIESYKSTNIVKKPDFYQVVTCLKIPHSVIGFVFGFAVIEN